MKYRPEIDGLRAFAVLPVILFHAGLELFSGGYVGVDVFFVISGYLITTLLVEDLETDRFSLLRFYERRARRILPALFVVMVVCVPFAWHWMLDSQLQAFSRSLIAVAVFASNVLFWSESGYFAAAAEEKPLLHTWSLAVEEQYYVLFPIFLYLTYRFARSRVFWSIVVVAALSLLLSEWASRHSSSANFYLLPTRAWELLAGSIAALLIRRHGVRPNNTLALLGFAAVVFAVFFFDESTRFPSVYALVPVGGVVLLILFAEQRTWVARLLSLPVLVGIGLISYSAYLWHQPLFAFARLRSLGAPTGELMGAMAVLSILVGYLSYRFVEQPFRNRSLIPPRTVWVTALSGLLVVLTAGTIGSIDHPQRTHYRAEAFPQWEDTDPCHVTVGFNNAEHRRRLREDCIADDGAIILLGDSHAESISASLREQIENAGGSLLTLTYKGCLPIPGTASRPPRDDCVSVKQAYWDFIDTTTATVVLSARWPLYLVGTRFDNGEGGIEYGKGALNRVIGDPSEDLTSYAIEFLGNVARSRRLVIASQIPEAGWHVPERIAKAALFAPSVSDMSVSTSYAIYRQRNADILRVLDTLEQHDNVAVVRVDSLVCDLRENDRCRNTLDGASLYRDDDHPSPLFARMIAQRIRQALVDFPASVSAL